MEDEIIRLKAEIFDLQVELGNVQKRLKDKINELNSIILSRKKEG